MNTRVTLAIAIIIIMSILSSILGWIGRGYWDRRHSLPPQIDTVWRHDTIRLVVAKPVGTIAAKLPVVREEGAPLQARDTLPAPDHFRDTTKMIIRDSVQVEVPIEQKTYEGENYRAVVQGFRPELLSIDIRVPELAVPEGRRKRWFVTIGPQLGYGFTPSGWQPYAGVGVTAGFSF